MADKLPATTPATRNDVINHSMDHVIPTRNQPALLGYYYSIFGLLPMVGLLLGPVAVVYGLIGLDRGNHLPRHIGYGHALFAVVAGMIGTIMSYTLAVSVGVFLLMSYMGNKWPFPPEVEPYEIPLEQLNQRVDRLEQLAEPGKNQPGKNLH